MGTNFYYRTDICGHCDRFKEIHVGKRSAGWSFAFRGYPHDLFNPEHPEWGFDPQSPFGRPVLSRTDWRKVFADVPGELRDEYGRRVEDDPVVWLDQRKAPDATEIRKEREMTSAAWWGNAYSPGARSWRDAEGFRFDAGEFS